MFNYLAGRNEPPASFFRALKEAFPWVNIEWLITGEGEMESVPRGVHQVATGNGHVQVGGSVRASGGSRIGGVHAGRDMLTVQEKGATWQSADKDLLEVVNLLRDYGSPKLIAELRNKLLQVKKAVEGE